MLGSIAIENFKGVGDRVTVDLRPITLLFGPNSGGKSTILQAMQYGFELLERGNVDADRTLHGGGAVDLGGFRNFVHNRDAGRSVFLRFDLDFADEDLPEFAAPVSDGEEERASARGFNDFLGEEIRTAWVELEVAWAAALSAPEVRAYRVGANGKPVGSIESSTGGTRVELCELGLGHELIRYAPDGGEELDAVPEEALEILEREGRIPLAMPAAIPSWQELLPCGPGPDTPDALLGISWEQFHYRISALVVGIGQVVRDRLAQFRYIGPLRVVPPRGYVPPRFAGDSRWDNGMAAWDLLHAGEGALLRRTDEWMGSEERLNTGVGIRRRRLRKVPQESVLSVSIESGAMLDDMDELQEELRGLPVETEVELYEVDKGIGVAATDVGAGIAQVLPVVVAALDTAGGHLLAIEQPELHVHPSIQVELGDLFALQIREGKQFLIETHSEHLILRLLNRIEQTTSDELPPEKPEVRPSDVGVVYVCRKDGAVTAAPIGIDEAGEFTEPWPDGFFEERSKELF